MTTPVCHVPRLLTYSDQELVILIAPDANHPANAQSMWWSASLPALRTWLAESPPDWSQFPGPVAVSRVDRQLLLGAVVSSCKGGQTLSVCISCRVEEDPLLEVFRKAVSPTLPPRVTQIDQVEDRVYLSGEAGTLGCRYLPGHPPFQFAEHQVTQVVDGGRLGHLVSAAPPAQEGATSTAGPCYYLTHEQALQIWPPGEGCEC